MATSILHALFPLNEYIVGLLVLSSWHISLHRCGSMCVWERDFQWFQTATTKKDWEKDGNNFHNTPSNEHDLNAKKTLYYEYNICYCSIKHVTSIHNLRRHLTTVHNVDQHRVVQNTIEKSVAFKSIRFCFTSSFPRLLSATSLLPSTSFSNHIMPSDKHPWFFFPFLIHLMYLCAFIRTHYSYTNYIYTECYWSWLVSIANEFIQIRFTI